MNVVYHDVKTFMEAADQLPAGDHDDLYIKLIEEEYTELLEARASKDSIEEGDACLDLIWVLVGHMVMKGWDVVGAWEEVARSNRAKIDPLTGKMNRRADGKALKPEGWTPPNLSPYLRK